MLFWMIDVLMKTFELAYITMLFVAGKKLRIYLVPDRAIREKREGDELKADE